eukprot:117515-Chlamydomonas_euryale.AAC.4
MKGRWTEAAAAIPRCRRMAVGQHVVVGRKGRGGAWRNAIMLSASVWPVVTLGGAGCCGD